MRAAQEVTRHAPTASRLHDVLIMEWWREDRCIFIEYTDSRIGSWPASLVDAVKTAAEVFGPERKPRTNDGAAVLRWTHFAED